MSDLVGNPEDQFSQNEAHCMYGQTCVKRPYKTRHILAFQTVGCLLLNESSAESSIMNVFMYFTIGMFVLPSSRTI